MPQYSKRLADEVRRVLQENGTNNRIMTLREAQARTRINYTTVASMLEGQIPRPETVTKFALGFGEDRGAWLEMCGYQDDNLPSLSLTSDDPEERSLLQEYRRIPKDKRHVVRSVIAGLAV